MATDAAGNKQAFTKTLNVDPSGTVSASEATATLEAADNTSESAVVAPTAEVLDPEQMANGDNPSLVKTESAIVSSGVPDTTIMTTDPEDGFTIHSPEGATTITPDVQENSSEIKISENVAGIAANITPEVDSVIRPEYNGVQTFQAIRSSAGAVTFSWSVNLSAGQTLHLVNSAQAEILYDEGERAFLITAEVAHDATGAAVPTSLAVDGNVLTLNVDHRSASYVYPVVAGQGWETSYEVPVVVEGPEDEYEEWKHQLEEEEQRQRELEAEWEGLEPSPPPLPLTEKQAEWLVSFGHFEEETTPPPSPGPNQATASRVRTFQIYRSQCGPSCGKWKAKVYNASFLQGPDWVKWEPGTEVHASVDQKWEWESVIWDTTWNCGAIGPRFVDRASGEHLIAYAHFTIESWFGSKVAPKEKNFGLQDWVYSNGFQEKHVKDWHGQPIDHICPRVAT